MPIKTFTVEVFTIPPQDAWAGKPAPKPTRVPGTTVDAKNMDAAMAVARTRLKDRGVLRSLSMTSPTTISAIVEVLNKT